VSEKSVLVIDDTAGDGTISLEVIAVPGESVLNAIVKWAYDQATAAINNGEALFGDPEGDTAECRIEFTLEGGRLGASFQMGEPGIEDGKPCSISKQLTVLLLEWFGSKIRSACPECGITLAHQGGCLQCPSCGYSRCEI